MLQSGRFSSKRNPIGPLWLGDQLQAPVHTVGQRSSEQRCTVERQEDRGNMSRLNLT